MDPVEDSAEQSCRVNLAKVKKLYIGLGDRAAPAAGGSGRMFIDDIQVIK